MAGVGYGKHHGKYDMERIGLFAEMEYLHGKGYTAPADVSIRDLSKSQMYPGIPKWKSGLQDCYFDQKFKRIFEKEGWSTAFSRDLKEKLEMKKKLPPGPAFMPSSYPKKHATPGDSYGTIGGPVKAFSPILKPVEKKGIEPPNVLTNPAKKGGPGYPNICLNKYPAHKAGLYDDPFVSGSDPRRKQPKPTPFLGGSYPNYFDRNPYLTRKIVPTYKKEFKKFEAISGPFYPPPCSKKLGGCKAGCFEKWPTYKSSPYNLPKDTTEKDKKGQSEANATFKPQTRNKTLYTKSIMSNKIKISVNATNWRNFKPVTFKREFLI